MLFPQLGLVNSPVVIDRRGIGVRSALLAVALLVAAQSFG